MKTTIKYSVLLIIMQIILLMVLIAASRFLKTAHWLDVDLSSVMLVTLILSNIIVGFSIQDKNIEIKNIAKVASILAVMFFIPITVYIHLTISSKWWNPQEIKGYLAYGYFYLILISTACWIYYYFTYRFIHLGRKLRKPQQ